MTEKPIRPDGRARVLIVAAIVIAFALVVGLKFAAPSEPAATKPSMVRDDPVAAYEAALSAGKPIYMLFHSLTCDPCVQISAVADEVVPEYTGKVTFVNAITDDPSGQRLASGFSFEYIPTSIFLAPDGTVTDSYTGVLSADEMRARLDALVAK